MQDSALRQDVLTTYSALQLSLEKLCAAIRSEPTLLAWVHEESDNPLLCSDVSAREKAITLLTQNEYLDTQAPREILVLPGYIGASPVTLKRLHEVNQAKDQFKKSVLALKVALNKPSELTQAMHAMGFARLHLKQCYRKIPLLKLAPLKISWTWAHTKSIKRITIEKAHEMLRKKGDDSGILLQIQKLSALPSHEQLAIVQELAPHLRANIVLSDENRTRLMIKGPVPIFFPCDSQTPHPAFKVPQKKSLRDQNRTIRKDVRLDPNPYLPAIRAHRYNEKVV